MSQTANGDLYVYRGSGHINGTTTFWSGIRIGNWAGHTNLALGDLTGDHLPDLLSQKADGNVWVYPGNGIISETNTFWSGTMIGPWIGYDHLVLGDLNGDGNADLLSQTANGDLHAYPGSGHVNSTTTFWAGTMIGNWAGHFDLALGDLSGDGKPDLLSQTAGGELYVYPGSGSINATTTFWAGTDIGPWVGHSNLGL